MTSNVPMMRWLNKPPESKRYDAQHLHHGQIIFNLPVEEEKPMSEWVVWYSKCKRYQIVKSTPKFEEGGNENFIPQHSSTSDGHNWRGLDYYPNEPSKPLDYDSLSEAISAIVKFHVGSTGFADVVTNSVSIVDHAERNGYVAPKSPKMKIPVKRQGKTPKAVDANGNVPQTSPKPKRASKGGVGVIGTLVLILERGWHTKEEILAELCKAFPEREENSMRGTIGAQIPNRLARERGVKIEVEGTKDKAKYRIIG